MHFIFNILLREYCITQHGCIYILLSIKLYNMVRHKEHRTEGFEQQIRNSKTNKVFRLVYYIVLLSYKIKNIVQR